MGTHVDTCMGWAAWRTRGIDMRWSMHGRVGNMQDMPMGSCMLLHSRCPANAVAILLLP